MAKYYFRFRVDFPRNARKQPCLHALPTSQYERGRRQSRLHCEPDLRFTVIQLHLRDNSCLALHPVFVLFCWTVKPSPVYALRTVMILTHGWTSFASTRTPRGKKKKCWKTKGNPVSRVSHFHLNCSELNRFVRAMSRKKAVKGKGSSRSPKASPSSGREGGRTGKGLAAAAAPSSGLVYPSRPSLSNSGEFYDIAFKVSWEFKLHAPT